MAAQGIEVDVLVVGLGPVGATLAALLAQRSVSVLAIDRDAQVYPMPRAVGFDHEVMRIFQGLHLIDGVLENCRFSGSYQFVNAGGEILLQYDRLTAPRPSGWMSHATFYQPAIERLLRDSVAQSQTGAIRLNTRLVSLTQSDTHVDAVLDGPEGELRVRARYLVGCDGGSSKVRSEIGVRLRDIGFDEPWLVVDFLSQDESGLPATNTQFCDPARPATFMRMGPGRHRWEIMLFDGETAEQALDDGFIEGFLRDRGFHIGAAIERKAVYRFHALIAQSWRVGRCLLAGDSAHQTPPFAGQGMCSGLRDAANLAWKIDAVLNTGASDVLLDTYQAEREPHVEGIIHAAIALGKVVCTTDPAVAAARDARMLADRRAGIEPVSMVYPPLVKGPAVLDTPGAGAFFVQPWDESGASVDRFDDHYNPHALLLCRQPPDSAGSQDGIVVRDLTQKQMQPFAAALSQWLDEHGAEAVLVRPDRYVFGTGDPAALTDAYARLAGIGAGLREAHG